MGERIDTRRPNTQEKSFAEQVIDDMHLSNHPQDLNDYFGDVYAGETEQYFA